MYRNIQLVTLFLGLDLSSAANAYVRHNVEKLSRIYPAGSRTDSSNYNPVPLWNAGCQIGTILTRGGNYQTLTLTCVSRLIM